MERSCWKITFICAPSEKRSYANIRAAAKLPAWYILPDDSWSAEAIVRNRRQANAPAVTLG
jgi:hypothetical protein